MAAGRQREFDTAKTLEKAMLVFWQNGYPGTSLTDLTTAMGINKPSLYAAFGNKEKLFNLSLELFLQQHGVVHSQFLAEKSQPLSIRVKNYLLSIAKMLTDLSLPKGCFVCLSTSEVAGSRLPDSTVKVVKDINQQSQQFLTDFFNQETAAGNLNSSHDAKVLASYLLTIQFGLAVAARNGSDLAQLSETIDFAVEMLK